MIQIRCKNNNQIIEAKEGCSILDILPSLNLDMPYPAISAKVNNTSKGLNFHLYHNCDVEILDIRDAGGKRAYIRSLSFVLYKAAQDIFPGCKLFIEHPISHGYYCNFLRAATVPEAPASDSASPSCATVPDVSTSGSTSSRHGITPDEVERIRLRMEEIISLDMPFIRKEVPTEEAIRLFREQGLTDKVKLLETTDNIYTTYYTLGDTTDYYYGPLVPSTGMLKVFGLSPYGDEGMLLRIPSQKNPDNLAEMTPQPKTFDVYKEHVKWNVIMRMANAGDANKACLSGHATEMIQVAEALQEKKIVKMAEEIDRRYREEGLKLVLITGPSSSGKTTFCKRLSVQLLACGLRPISFSTDDYFVNRVDTPLLPDGRYDFENFETVDHRLLSDHLSRLIKGEEVEIPEYNFKTGKREYNGKRVRLTDKHVLLIEGIHALNPRLTPLIEDRYKFKIYISALTSISLDDHNWIPTRDNRLLRRIIRDYNKGAFSARETIAQWPLVAEGEEQWIFPYQEDADVMFNSALNIEFAILRHYAEPILSSVPKNCPEYSEAHRLLNFIHYFVPINDKDIPPTSIMREFVGGSSFKY